MSIKYNEFGEVISVNGITTGQHLGAPMQDAIAEKTEDNEAYGIANRTVSRGENVIVDNQPKQQGGASSWNDLEDMPFGEEVSEGVILDEIELDFMYEGRFDLSQRLELVEGESYIVNWKNEVYECIALAVEADGFVMTTLGDIESVMAGDIPQNPPFCISVLPIELANQFGQGTSIVNDNNPEIVKCSIIGKTTTIKTLDEKYMPLLTSPSGKKFKITVDDKGAITATEV